MHLFGRKRRQDPRYLANTTTMFGTTRIYDVRYGDVPEMRVLDVEGTWQSACYLGPRSGDLAFAYHRRFADVIEACPQRTRHALMLGGGGFAFPVWLLGHDEQVQVDVVELDPAITELASRFLSLSQLDESERARLTIHTADAIDYLRRLGGQAVRDRYDLVVNDLFAADRPVSALMEPSGLQMVHDLMVPGGLYLANVVSALKGSRARALRRTLDAADATFADLRVISLGADEPRAADNNVLIASDADLSWLA